MKTGEWKKVNEIVIEALELEDLEEGHVGVGVNGHRDVEQDAELPAREAVGEEGAAGEPS